jgi:hypothetical protein
VNEDIMHHEISNTIKGNSDTNVKQKAIPLNKASYAKEEDGYAGEYDEEVVVLLKEMWGFVMVIFMQVPEQTMHNVFMC